MKCRSLIPGTSCQRPPSSCCPHPGSDNNALCPPATPVSNAWTLPSDSRLLTLWLHGLGAGRAGSSTGKPEVGPRCPSAEPSVADALGGQLSPEVTWGQFPHVPPGASLAREAHGHTFGAAPSAGRQQAQSTPRPRRGGSGREPASTREKPWCVRSQLSGCDPPSGGGQAALRGASQGVGAPSSPEGALPPAALMRSPRGWPPGDGRHAGTCK